MKNFVFISGRAGNDPQVRYNDNGTVVASFTVAISEKLKTKNGEIKEVTTWVNVIAWGNLAKAIEQSIKKGYLVNITGKLQVDKWQSANGTTNQKTYILLDSFNSINTKADSSDIIAEMSS